MDINKILEYQKLDSELFKIEKALRDNEDKKIANQMQQNAKVAQERSFKLDEKAKELEKEFSTAKAQYEIQRKKMEEVFAKDVDTLPKEEVEKLVKLKDKLSQNLAILERNFAKLAENMNSLLSDFNKTKNAYQMAKEQYGKSRQNFDKAQSDVQPRKEEIAQQLKQLEKGIDPKIVEAYKKRRSENIFPVVVPLTSNCCGGCRMELSMANLSKLKDEKVLTCEHCHRIIFAKD